MTSPITAPQPKTFAPSRDDVLTTLAYFFGAPVSPEKLIDYNEHHAQTYHFPDAYFGSNTRLRDTLNNLILKVRLASSLRWTRRLTRADPFSCRPQSPQSWQTSIGLPFVSIEGTVRAPIGSASHWLHLSDADASSRAAGRRVGRNSLRCSPHATCSLRRRFEDA